MAAFFGNEKPKDSNEFFKEFVEELYHLIIHKLKDKSVSVVCEAIICDAPAKSYAFNLKGHTGYDSCPKCEIGGVYATTKVKGKAKNRKRGAVCFPGTGPFKMKTDNGFIQNLYEDFDSGKETILKNIPHFGCITSVPLDYMHLLLLGVTKKLIRLWTSGPPSVKVDSKVIEKITKKLLIVRNSTPSEFARKPRSINEYTKWKATEFRTFLLYTGPVVLKNIFLDDDRYENFLLLHTAISILVNEKRLQSLMNIDYCQELLIEFM